MSVDLTSRGVPGESSAAQLTGWTASFEGSPPKLAFVSEPEGSTAELAADGELTVLFDGVLFNHDGVAGSLPGLKPASRPSEVVLATWRARGAQGIGELRGSFAVAVHDRSSDELVLFRDPLGSHPLFYARTDAGLLLSASTNALAAEPAVPARLNRALLADTFWRRWPIPDETFYEEIKRVPSGHLLRARRGQQLQTDRYWDPAPSGVQADWADEEEVGRFDDLLNQAVDRCLSTGPAAIYLSGGLDSISVAAVARDRTALHGLPPPRALSLAFPDPQSNEEEIQRAVAAKLELPQTFVSIEDAAGNDGLLLRTVLDLSSGYGAPIIGCWLPGYRRLGLQAKADGYKAILTGAGGDEWLGISFYLAADLLRRFDLPGLMRLGRLALGYYDAVRPSHLPKHLWIFGVRPILRAAALRALQRTAPALVARRRRRRALAVMPDWVAPDADVREALLDRAAQGLGAHELRGSESFYDQYGRMGLDHAIVSMELEEVFENGKHLGMQMMQPYWDPDLVDLLYRISPETLTRGGRAKSLVRETLARRFPDLGLEKQKKVIATNYFTSVMLGEGRSIWKEIGGLQALIELGVVDARRVEEAANRMFSSGRTRAANRIWNMLNFETWVRRRI